MHGHESLDERLGSDADHGDPRQYCKHGTWIGSWWGPDFLCGPCEMGVPVCESCGRWAPELDDDRPGFLWVERRGTLCPACAFGWVNPSVGRYDGFGLRVFRARLVAAGRAAATSDEAVVAILSQWQGDTTYLRRVDRERVTSVVLSAVRTLQDEGRIPVRA